MARIADNWWNEDRLVGAWAVTGRASASHPIVSTGKHKGIQEDGVAVEATGAKFVTVAGWLV